jgi:hypothetical protein
MEMLLPDALDVDGTLRHFFALAAKPRGGAVDLWQRRFEGEFVAFLAADDLPSLASATARSRRLSSSFSAPS